MSLPKPYYDHAGITIYHADCREILPYLPKVDLVLTDPPYGIGWSRGDHGKVKSRGHSGIQNDSDTSARDEALAIIGTVPAIVFGSFYAPFPANVKQVLIWQKPADSGLYGSTTGFRRDAEPIFLLGDWGVRTVESSCVLQGRAMFRGTAAAESGSHPHVKPTDLIGRLIRHAPPTETILDPFMGSGTTLVAAKQLGRKAIGIEIEEKYCEIAVERLSQEVLFTAEPGPEAKQGSLI